MAEKDEKPKIIIIKKVKKGHAGGHGGSWKVAYADFVTAMMALFLLLWLISMVSPEKKVVLSEFFKHFSVFEHGQSFMEGGKYPIKQEGAPVGQTRYMYVQGLMEVPVEKVRAKVEEAIRSKLSEGAKEHVFIESAQNGGLRIQIVDRAGSNMFDLGSDKPTDKAMEIMKVVAESLKDVQNSIAIEGHTDANPFRTGQITNWELSTGRASAARREFEKAGIDPNRFDRVVGFADKDPYIKEDAFDPRNRRISLLVLPMAIKPGEAPGIVKQPGIAPGAAPAPGAAITAPPAQPKEPEKVEPIDKSKVIGDVGVRPTKPDFLKE